MTYTVEIEQSGRGGTIRYVENREALSFDWEFAMDGADVFVPAAEEWDLHRLEVPAIRNPDVRIEKLFAGRTNAALDPEGSPGEHLAERQGRHRTGCGDSGKAVDTAQNILVPLDDGCAIVVPPAAHREFNRNSAG